VADASGIQSQESDEQREERLARESALARVQSELTALLDEMISTFQSEIGDDEVKEHLSALRALLTSQVGAYLGWVLERRTTLPPTTSEMYAGEVVPAPVVSTTLKGLVDGAAMSAAQAARLTAYVADHRTLLIFGDRATGKSTLLNALLELVSVDERFVSVEHLDHLPALRDRAFCVRLSVNDSTDVETLFTKALKMHPNRIVVGELHADEILYFLRAVDARSGVGGFATVRADSVHKALAKLVRQMELVVEGGEAKQLLGATRPVLVHMRSDEKGLPRVAALWEVDGTDAEGEIVVREESAG
jgi:type IV secretory pathway ATPase VirB11/archaellum biosynthesis ATPase